MELETVSFGWYFRVLTEIAFVKVFLASGNLSEALAHAKYCVELACAIGKTRSLGAPGSNKELEACFGFGAANRAFGN
jgi:hypothetical protein